MSAPAAASYGPARPRWLTKTNVGVGLLAIPAALIGVFASAEGEDALRILAIVVLGVCCGGLLLYSLSVPWLRGEVFQPAVGFALVAFVGYGLGALHSRYGVTTGTHSKIDALPGLLMGLVATGCFFLGYIVPLGRKVDGAWLQKRWPEFHVRRAFLGGLVLVGVGAIADAYYFLNGEYFAYSTSDNLSEQFSTVGYFRELLFVGITIMAISAYMPSGTRLMRRCVVAIAAVALGLLLPTAIRYDLLYVAVALLLPRHFLHRRLPFASVLVAIVIIVGVIYPVGELYRHQYQSQSFGSQSFTETIAGVQTDLTALGPGGYVDYTFGPALGRVDLATPAAALQTIVPSVLDYQLGATFMPALLIFIPRPLWQDKPFFQYDNLLGRLEGLLSPRDFRTSIKYSYVGELFLDFGWPGVVVGMALYGLLFRLFFQFAVLRKHPLGILAYSLALTAMWTVESPLGPVLGTVIRELITAFALLWVMGVFRVRTRAATGSISSAEGIQSQFE